MTNYHTVVASPVGEITLHGDGEALTGLYMTDQRWRPQLSVESVSDHGPFGSVSEQLAEYFAGERSTFDLQLGLRGTTFQLAVWRALSAIVYGSTMSYGQLARAVGTPGASRAVGAANGRNPIGIVIPCHRVIGADGSLTGYGGGIDRKRQLLRLEGFLAA